MASDLTGVQRILGMLTSRKYELTSFQARRESASASWLVELGVATDEGGADLLTKRLSRFPSTTDVRDLGIEVPESRVATGT